MKKSVLFLLVLLLLLTACYPVTEIPSDSSQPTSGTQETTADTITQDTTTDTTTQETTESTDPAEAELTADICLLAAREMLTYEEFFGTDRSYGNGRTNWVVPADEGLVLFDIESTMEDRCWRIYSDAYEGKYKIPGAEAYKYGYGLLSADGVYAYFVNDVEVVQLNMRTGEARKIVECDYIASASIRERDALYYVAVTDGKLAVKRLYIPTMQEDMLYDGFPEGTPYGPQELYFTSPGSTQGAFTVQYVNPEMLKLVNRELSNPDSKYNVEMQGLNIQILWDKTAEQSFGHISRMRVWLYYFIQEDTGVRAYEEVTYKPADKSESRRLGIIDNCWFGSGYPHDHFNPEITHKEDPVFELGEWVDIPDLTPIEETVSTVAYAEQFGPNTLYRYENGILKQKLTDMPVSNEYDGIFVTEENVLVQINADGSACNILYEGKDRIRHLDRLGEKLYFLDGDTMIELDIENAKYRTLLEYTGIVSMYLDNYWDKKGNEYARIYFAVGEGLFVQGYLYDMQTGELDKGYRL